MCKSVWKSGHEPGTAPPGQSAYLDSFPTNTHSISLANELPVRARKQWAPDLKDSASAPK